LSYQARLEGKGDHRQISARASARTIRTFSHALTFDRAEKIERRREKYELFAGGNPHVDHVLNHRRLVFRNANQAAMEIETGGGW